MPERKFEIVKDDEPARPDHSAAIQAIMLGLKALSQRALIAIDNLFTLLTVGSGFWLWLSIPDPNVYQLVGMAMYALFVLAANVIVRRK